MKYFTLKELCASATAEHFGIDNTPSANVINNLYRLVRLTLDPAREAFGAPITVNSGYRCTELNKRVGGAARSYHLVGRTADLNAGSPQSNRRLLKILATLPHVELISERNVTWIHVAV